MMPIEQLEQDLQQYTTLYTAEFNTKIIGAIWSSGQGESKVVYQCEPNSDESRHNLVQKF
jgi:hypothetical protein